jgi:hypothetical protein
MCGQDSWIGQYFMHKGLVMVCIFNVQGGMTSFEIMALVAVALGLTIVMSAVNQAIRLGLPEEEK